MCEIAADGVGDVVGVDSEDVDGDAADFSFAGVLGLGVLFAVSPEAPELPEEGELDEELPSPVLGFESDDDDEFPPDSLLSAFLRDSDG